MLYEQQERGIYLNILMSDGTFRQTVTEDTPGAVRRDWQSKDGKTSGTKWEKIYPAVDGTISGITFYEGEYGKNLVITLDDGDERYVLSIKSDSPYAEDLMKKIPNIAIADKVKFSPYSFEDEKGKLRRGITVEQNGKKVQSYFYDFHTKKACNGYPEFVYKVDRKTGKKKDVSTEEWKIYFASARLWLIEYIEEHHLMRPANASAISSEETDAVYAKAMEGAPDDEIPF